MVLMSCMFRMHVLLHFTTNYTGSGLPIKGNPYYILLQVQGNSVVTVIKFNIINLFCSNSRVITGNHYYNLLQTTRESTLSQAEATTCYSPFWKKCSKCMVRVVEVTCLVVQPSSEILGGISKHR